MAGRDGCVSLFLLLHGLDLAHTLETLRIVELIRSLHSLVIKPALVQETQEMMQEPDAEE